MDSVNLFVFLLLFTIIGIHCAVLQKNDINEIDHQGLYDKKDKVVILAKENFEDLIYGQKHAWLIQFYNSFCGHCRAFYPKFKEFAADIENWSKVVHVGVVDCSVEDNIEICRQYEVMQYPSLRYLHENYVKGNNNIGDTIEVKQDAETVTNNLLVKLKDEQLKGRLTQAPLLGIFDYTSLTDAIKVVPKNFKYTFLIFEDEKSLIGSKVILDTNNYDAVAMRVSTESQLAHDLNIRRFPGLVAVRKDLQVTPLTPKSPSRESLLNAMNVFLQYKNIPIPSRESNEDMNDIHEVVISSDPKVDMVYLGDLETTLRNSLHIEISRYKTLRGETLQALLDYLSVLIDYFPFRANGKEYLQDLRGRIKSRSEWSGLEVAELVKSLEKDHAPVYASALNYVGCKGSEPQYRGYSCGLWTLFHTLTVGAATTPGGDAPSVLRAMYGYVKHFFGCTECSQHFQDMAERNKIWEVRQNDKAVLWLWISHNEVNLRLAGDITEDPAHPKLQFPSTDRCAECRLARGAWRLPAVYRYLLSVYSPDSVRSDRYQRDHNAANNSNLHLSLTAIMYILFLSVLLLVCKVFVMGARRLIGNRAYRRRALGLYAKKDYSCLK